MSSAGHGLARTVMLAPRWESAPLAASGRAVEYAEQWVLLAPAIAARLQLNPSAATAAGRRYVELTAAACSEAPLQGRRLERAAARTLEVLQRAARATDRGNVLVQVIVAAADRELQVLSAMLKSAQLEHPHLLTQLLAVDEQDSAEGLMQKISYEALEPAAQYVRYEGRGRFRETFVELPQPHGEACLWKDHGTYLITGGLGALGLLLAEEAASRARDISLILVGRSRISENDDRLRRLRSRGVRVTYRPVDLSSSDAVRALIADVHTSHAGVNAIVHAAGVLDEAPLCQLEAAQLAAALAPKVRGLINLDRATSHLHLEHFVLFSSVCGVLGNVGQSHYALANAFLDCFARERCELVGRGRRHGTTVSIAWPYWERGRLRPDERILARLRSRSTLASLATEAGLRALYQAVGAREPNVLVLAGDPARIRAALSSGTAAEQPGPIATASGTGARIEAAASDERAREALLRYLRDVLAEGLQVPGSELDPDATLDRYGMDSLLASQLAATLARTFPGLPQTLLFEFQTVCALCDYLLDAHRARALEVTGLACEPERLGARSQASGQLGACAPVEAPAADTDSEPLEVAIIGLSGRYPQAPDIETFWENLRSGVDSIREIPKERWDHTHYFDPEKGKPGKCYSKWGGFLEGVDEFDPLFFNISPFEAEVMDPQERLFLQCAHATLEDAGYTRRALGRDAAAGSAAPVGVFVGVMYEEYQLYGAQAQSRGCPLALGGNPSSIANRVSWFFNFGGPSLAVDTMCSSSLTAMHLACQALRAGDCELALAGGVNVSVHPNKYLMLSQAGFASSKGRCESFGAGGDGYVPGEGVGAVLLKPLARALADRDRIYAVIGATALNHGGKTHGYTVPNPASQGDLVARALRRAGIHPRAVSYIEAHGTGTSLGDPIEIAGLMRAFAPHSSDKGYCAIGSVKSNIGHLESAAGIAGVTKVLLQMQHRALAPSLHAEVLNPRIDFDGSPFVVQRELAEWQRPRWAEDGQAREAPRIAGVSSFGAGGANAHVVLKEYIPEGKAEAIDPPTPAEPALIVLSARRPGELRDRAAALLATLEKRQCTDADLPHIAYTLQVGREPMAQRLGFATTSIGELKKKLSAFVAAASASDGHTSPEHSTEALRLLGSDEDMAEAIEAWIAKGKYEKVLQAWVNGMDVDWERLYAGHARSGRCKPRRIGLPTYPFARQRCWITVDGVQPVAPAASSFEPLHPLLHEQLESKDGWTFRTRLSGSDVSDHTVNGVRILPAAAYIEILRAAAQRIPEGRRARPARPAAARETLVLKDLVWPQALQVDEQGKSVETNLLQRRGGELVFDVASLAPVSQEPTLHCAGSLEFSWEQGDAPPLDLRHLSSLCQRRISGPQCYATFAALRLDYGDTHRVIESLDRGTDRSGKPFALVTLAARHGAGARKAFVLNPGMLDGAIQGSLGCVPEEGGGSPTLAMLPFAAARVEVVGPTPEEAVAYVRPADGEAGEDSDALTLDIDLCDRSGATSVRVRGLRLRKVRLPERHPESDAGVTGAVAQDSHVGPLELPAGGAARQPPSALAGEDVLLDVSDLPAANERRQLDHLLARVLGVQLQVLGALPGSGASAGGASCIESYRPWMTESLRVLDEHGLTCGSGSGCSSESLPQLDPAATWRDWEVALAKWRTDAQLAPQITLVDATLRALPAILSGKQLPTEVLFPGAATARLEGLYRNNRLADRMNRELAERLAHYLDERLRRQPDATFRVLEVGAGTGGASVCMLELLQRYAGHVDEYAFTDVSRVFLQSAREQSWARARYLDFRLCDIERPLEAQGFAPGHYDVVIASNVVHATRNVRTTVRNLKAALRADGLLLLNELESRSLFGHLTLGLLPGWWTYEDPELRIRGCPALESRVWKDVLQCEGFFASVRAAPHSGLGQQVIAAVSNGVLRRACAPQPAAPVDATPLLPAASQGGTAPLSGELTDAAVRYVKQAVGAALKLAIEEIDADEPFERYGVDSIIVVRVSAALRGAFPSLSATALFEQRNIRELVAHLLRTDASAFQRVLQEGGHVADRASSTGTPVDAPARSAKAASQPPLQPVRFEPKEATADRSSRAAEDVAVIGMSGRFPAAHSVREFWANLRSGRNCITEVPADRWDWRDYLAEEPDAPGGIRTRWGGFMADIDKFDAAFFRISPREAEQMDPQERLLLQEAYACIEDAGHTPGSLSPARRVGVFVGAMNNTYTVQPMHWSVANRISHSFDFKGPSVGIDTACSASLTAVHLAMESLRSGDCDCALVGGVNVIASPEHFMVLSMAGMLTSGERCKAFGEGADGFVAGEAVAAVLLKPLHLALRDGDRIHGVIKGSAINHGGATRGYTVPSAAAQADVISRALHSAGISAREISYIEAHGTGTALGDPIEVAGLTRAFEQDTRERGFCPLGSAKSNVGHCESAAGIVALVKVLQQLTHGELAPSLHCETPNAQLELAASPFMLQRELAHWKRPLLDLGGGVREVPRTAGISSFGAGGANTHVIVQEYTGAQPAVAAAAGPALIVLSARTAGGLRERAGSLLAMVESGELFDADLGSVAYTLQVGREPMEFRAGMQVRTVAELAGMLRRILAGEPTEGLFCDDVANHRQVLRLFNGTDVSVLAGQWLANGQFSKLLELWSKGLDIDWKRLYGERRPRRLSLPTYPFAKERHWKSASAASLIPWRGRSPAAGATPGARLPLDRWFYVPSWRAASLAARTHDDVNTRYIVFADEGEEFSGQLLEQLREQTCELVVVSPGEDYAQPSPAEFRINPAEPQHYERLLRALSAEAAGPLHVFHCWNIGHRPAAQSVSEFLDRQKHGFASILHLTQARARALPQCLLRLTVAASELLAVGAEPVDPAKATLIGICRVLPQELPDVTCVLVDVPAGRATGLERTHVAWLLQEMAVVPRAHTVAYRGARRYVQTYDAIELGGTNARAVCRDNGLYVISGGLGAIGLALAERLAQRYRARLLILTRRSLTEECSATAGGHDEWSTDRMRRLRQIESHGGQVMVAGVDVADPTAVAGAITAAVERYGQRVDGIFHLAGELRDESINKPLLSVTARDFERQFRPKAGGFYALQAAVRGQPPDFMLLFSSNSAVLGGFGLGAYAAANAFLDQAAVAQEAAVPLLTINTDEWEVARPGLAVPAEASGLRAHSMSVEEGLDAVLAAMTVSGAAQVIVSPTELQARIDTWLCAATPTKSAEEAVVTPAADNVVRLRPGRVPATDLERAVLAIWEEALGVKNIGLEEDFLDLGGNSLIGMRVLTRVRDLFGVEIPMEALLGRQATAAALVVAVVTELARTADVDPDSLPVAEAGAVLEVSHV